MRAVEGVRALLRYAATEADAAARAVLVAPQGGVAADDARTLLATAGERATLLEVIARGAAPDATRFAHGLDAVRAAYRTPDASASAVLATAFAAFPVGARRDARGARTRRAGLRRGARVRAAVGSRAI